VSGIRTRVERLERGHGGVPPTILVALARMKARETLFEESWLHARRRIESQLAVKENRPPKPIEPARGQTRRFERARQLLGTDDDDRHRADRDALLDWELRTQGKPGRYARLWAGSWQRRRVEEILREVAAKHAIEHRDETDG
jgi:hypothetical protein